MGETKVKPAFRFLHSFQEEGGFRSVGHICQGRLVLSESIYGSQAIAYGSALPGLQKALHVVFVGTDKYAIWEQEKSKEHPTRRSGLFLRNIITPC